eukprot:2520936-Prymnesium_polylepis.1
MPGWVSAVHAPAHMASIPAERASLLRLPRGQQSGSSARHAVAQRRSAGERPSGERPSGERRCASSALPASSRSPSASTPNSRVADAARYMRRPHATTVASAATCSPLSTMSSGFLRHSGHAAPCCCSRTAHERQQQPWPHAKRAERGRSRHTTHRAPSPPGA